MEWWQYALLIIGTVGLSILLAGWYLWRKATSQTKGLGARIRRLTWRSKLDLALAIMTDPDVPLRARILPPLLIVYLSLPIDLIPDFIPLIGQIDDILVLAVGLGLMLNAVPIRILDSRIAAIERAQDIASRRTINA